MNRVLRALAVPCFAVFFGGMVILFATIDVHAEPVTLVDNGQSQAAIVLADVAFDRETTVERNKRKRGTSDPAGQERLAAEELQQHVLGISDATLEITRKGTPLGDRCQ
jgi:hypothetical protein